MSETKNKNTTSTATSPVPPTTNNNNQSGKNVTAQVGKVAAAATGVAATGWVTGLKLASRIRQEFIGANLYLIGFLIVLF